MKYFVVKFAISDKGGINCKDNDMITRSSIGVTIYIVQLVSLSSLLKAVII